MNATVIAALITAAVAFSGWMITGWRENNRRRLEKRLEYATRQIEEFYGPLFNLAHQIFIANHVQDKILSARNTDGSDILNSAQQAAVEDFFQREHFDALHAEISQILKTKLHLVRGTEMPDSFYAYLQHALQERDQRQLWEKKQIDTRFVEGVPFPEDFYNELKSGLSAAMQDYEIALGGLKRRW